MKSKSFKATLAGAIVVIAASLAFAPAAFAAATPLLVGQTGSIAIAQAPDASADEAPIYASSDKKIISVNSAGIFKAKKAGKATLTSTDAEGAKQSHSYTVYAQDVAKTSKPKATSSLIATQLGQDTALLKWTKVSGVDGYVVYQKLDGSYTPVKVVEGNSTKTCSIDRLAPNESATFAVSSYKKVTVKIKQGKKTVKEKRLALSAKSPYATLLIQTDDSTKANADGVAFARNQITIVKSGTAEVMARAKSSSETLPVFSDKLRYISSNPDVATVDAQGNVQSNSKKAASCTITAIAHNGLRATIKVLVITGITHKEATFIAHRGDTQAAPENTTAAVVMAALNGYKAIEFDVWETRSGDLVVLHDQNMKRMYGVSKDIRELNTSDISSPDYYGNFKVATGTNLDQYRGLTVPSFEEIVRLASGFGLDVAVHIKSSGSDGLTQAGINKMLSILKLYNMQDKTTLVTSDKATLHALKEATGFKTQFLILTNNGYDITGANYIEEMRKAADDAKSEGASCISIKYRTAAPFDVSLIDYCHKLGLDVSTWDVSSNKRACLLVDMGVDSLTVDKKLFK